MCLTTVSPSGTTHLPLPVGLFLYTRAFNPRLPPALAARVNVVNLALGAEALEQRLLAVVLNHMQPKADLAARQVRFSVSLRFFCRDRFFPEGCGAGQDKGSL